MRPAPRPGSPAGIARSRPPSARERRRHRDAAAAAANFPRGRALHGRLALLRVEPQRVPRVAEAERLSTEELGQGVVRAVLRFGFAEDPDVPAALRGHGAALGLDPDKASFFVGREVPVASMRPDLSGWQEALFGFLSRNAVRASDHFRVPPRHVVELGTRVEV